jgi:hypothetical protein
MAQGPLNVLIARSAANNNLRNRTGRHKTAVTSSDLQAVGSVRRRVHWTLTPDVVGR